MPSSSPPDVVYVVVENSVLPKCLEPRRPAVFGSGIQTDVEELWFPRPSHSYGSRRSFWFGLGLLFACWVGFAFGAAEIEHRKLIDRLENMVRDLTVIEGIAEKGLQR